MFTSRLAGLVAVDYKTLAAVLHRTLLISEDPTATARARDAVMSAAAAATEARRA